MAQINFILQGKGDVGKSVCSALLAQYKNGRDPDPPTPPTRTRGRGRSR